ncbi:MAG: HD domain-containing protein [Oligoflexia bacterium]|nr:HD domain-containing protein [Oligoflexia bacterium]
MDTKDNNGSVFSKNAPQDSEFLRVSTEVIKNITNTFFDVYILRGNKFVKLFKKDSRVDVDRIKNYEDKGLANLYIHNTAKSSYMLKADQVAANILQNQELPLEKKTEIIHEITSLIMTEIFIDTSIDKTLLAKTLETSKEAVKHLTKDNNTMIAFIRSANSDFYLLKHSVSVCVISVLLAKALAIESPKILTTIGVAGLLHDIGMAQISKEIVHKKIEEMNADELKEYKLHPLYGMNIAQHIKEISPEVRQVIYQHHEQPNGQGFPNYLRSNDIAYMSKIVSIADSFCTLTAKHENKESYEPYEAIALMQEQVGVFDPEMLASFVELFLPKKEKK